MLQSVFLSVLAISGPIKAVPKVEGASLFKNGLALVIRDIPIKGTAEYLVEDVPTATLGTLWLRTGEGVKIKHVTTEAIQSQESIASMDQLLDENVGQKVTLILEGLASVSGVIVDSKGSLVSIQKEDGGKISIPKMKVVSVSGEAKLNTSRSIKDGKKALKISVEAPTGGKLQLVSLEKGLSWAPNYSIELGANNKVRFIGKATVMNDLMNLDGANLQFITGFPNVPYAELPDPLTHQKGLSDFLGLIAQFEQKPNQYGFGYVRSQNVSAGGRAGEISNFSQPGNQGVPLDPLSADRIEDMFYHKKPGVTLEKNERAYFQLFDAATDYEDVYTWTIDPERDYYYYYSYDVDRMNKEFLTDIWHSVRFKNPAGMPVSTAAAVITRDGRIAGQDMLKFTPTTGYVEAKITKAMQISASIKEELTQRVIPNRGTIVKGTIVLVNGKPEPVTVRLRKILWGKFVECDFHHAGSGPRYAWKPQETMEWTEKLEPGQRLERTYSYERR